MEKTLIIIKPDAVNKGNIGNIISIYENSGFIIENIKTVFPDMKILENHYAEHIGKSFYDKLIKFMCSGKSIVMIIKKENAVEEARKINGSTDPSKADKGTVRYLYGTDVTMNAVHASANNNDAEREIRIWF